MRGAEERLTRMNANIDRSTSNLRSIRTEQATLETRMAQQRLTRERAKAELQNTERRLAEARRNVERLDRLATDFLPQIAAIKEKEKDESIRLEAYRTEQRKTQKLLESLQAGLHGIHGISVTEEQQGSSGSQDIPSIQNIPKDVMDMVMKACDTGNLPGIIVQYGTVRNCCL